MDLRAWLRGRVRFDRNELAGAFGDLGTDFPLLAGMILASNFDAASVLVVFGAMQILSGLAYGLPMPVQPLKLVAVLVITHRIAPPVVHGAGLAIGILMLAFSATGILALLARAVPRSVVRGVQFGLGVQLALLALGDYVRADGVPGYVLAGAGFALAVVLYGNRRVPAALVLVGLGLAYAFATKLDPTALGQAVGFDFPEPRLPAWPDVWTGFLVLALPQVPLSVGNSILATRQTVSDLFPGREPSVGRLGLTYACMNLASPFFGGVPTCHGSGGLAGHHAFGARTGGSVVIYGALYLALGLFLAQGFHLAVELFPRPILGVILLFEAVALMRLLADVAPARAEFLVALLVGVAAVALPYGYVLGLAAGSLLAHATRRGILEDRQGPDRPGGGSTGTEMQSPG